MSYTITSPTQHLKIGWMSMRNRKYGGYVIRECDQFDKDTFDCEFRVCHPYETEYIVVDGNIQFNPLHWNRPARRYANGIEVWMSDENDENGKWYKWRGELELHDRCSQDPEIV